MDGGLKISGPKAECLWLSAWMRPSLRATVIVLLAGLVACGGATSEPQVEAVPLQSALIAVQSALITPSFTLNGGAFPLSEYHDGNLVLRGATPATASDVVALASSHDISPAAVRVVQGDYSVYYQHETGTDVPQNRDAPVQTGVGLNSNQDLVIDVTAWQLRPGFTLNGGSFPLSEYDDGVFYLQPAAGGERIEIGNSHTMSPDPLWVMPGSYDVFYALETGGNLVPNNQNAVVMSGVDIAASVPLAVDLPVVGFRLDASLDGQPFPPSQYQQAAFMLRHADGDVVELGKSDALPLTVSVIEGSYDIIYRHVQGDQLPLNRDVVVASDVLIGTPGTNGGVAALDIAMTSVVISPSFTLNGSAFAQSEYNNADFYLRGLTDEDVMLLGASEIASPAPVRVVPGTYDVLYRHETGAAVPQNANAVVLSDVLLDMNGGLAIDVPSVSVTGRFTLNGNSFPADAGNSVQFFLQGEDADDVFLFGFSDIASNEAVNLVSINGSYDSYDVLMDHLNGDAVPQNQMHAVDFNNLLDADQTLLVDIPAVRVASVFTLDGVAFPASIYQSARFYLRDIHTGSLIFLGRSDRSNNPVMVIKEDHEIIYEHFSGEQVPQNTHRLLGIVDL
ncbi:MAG: hypothetical protein RRB22_13570 [Gammaproteobacteria bacterium]|nr:hypothetical protein [Gammaproteobacteria bacterium]